MDQTAFINYFLTFNTVMAGDVSTQLTRNEAVLNTRIFSSARLLTPQPNFASGDPLAWNIKWICLFNTDIFSLDTLWHNYFILAFRAKVNCLYLFFPNWRIRNMINHACPAACSSAKMVLSIPSQSCLYRTHNAGYEIYWDSFIRVYF